MTPEQVLRYADRRLKASEGELLEALAGDLTDCHRLVVGEVIAHVEDLGQRIDALFQELLDGLAPQKGNLDAFQTIPGVDRMAAAMVLVEIEPIRLTEPVRGYARPTIRPTRSSGGARSARAIRMSGASSARSPMPRADLSFIGGLGALSRKKMPHGVRAA